MKNDIMLVVVVTAPVVIICIIVFLLNVVFPMLAERKYIKNELGRACSDRDYAHWKRILKRLYISCIPIVGKRLSERVKK